MYSISSRTMCLPYYNLFVGLQISIIFIIIFARKGDQPFTW